jgi:hypothetical protein
MYERYNSYPILMIHRERMTIELSGQSNRDLHKAQTRFSFNALKTLLRFIVNSARAEKENVAWALLFRPAPYLVRGCSCPSGQDISRIQHDAEIKSKGRSRTTQESFLR